MIINNHGNAQAIRMLQEMQAMAGGSRNEQVNPAADGQQGFAGALKNALGTVNSLQADAGAKTNAFTAGEDIPLTEVMIATQKSRVAFEATKEVRNKLLEAYQTIFNMPV